MSDIEERCRKAFKSYGLSSILWNVTYQCDLKCWHCYIGDPKNKKDELNTEQAKKLISTLGDMNVPLLFMTGGEPLLRKDIFDLIKLCKEYDITTVLSSNGLLITKEVARKLRRDNIHYIAVSVYGPPSIHDKIVGLPGSFDKLMENAKACINEGINFCFKTVVSNYTYDHIPYIFKKGSDLGVKSFYICDLVETGRAHDGRDWRISHDQWLELADFLFDKVDVEGGAEVDIGACPSLAPLAIEYFKKKNVDVNHAFERLGSLSSCPIGQGPLGISARGDVLPCIFMQNFSVGNILKDDLRTVAFHPTIQAIAEKNGLKGICGSCSYKQFCGGCRAKSHLNNGDIIDEDFTCLLYSPESDCSDVE
jgi:radical SAM protein with 4Fe4S-binding SPASM domain